MFTKDGIKNNKLLVLPLVFVLALMLVSCPWEHGVHAAQKAELKIKIQQQAGTPFTSAEVYLHNPSGMAAGQLELLYDSKHFSVRDVSRGALLEQGGFNFQANTGEAGVISAAWFALEGAGQEGGPLLTATFVVEEAKPLELELKNFLLYGEDGSPIRLGPATGEIELQIGRTEALVDGAVFPLETAPFIREGRTMVPLRFVSEQLGAAVEWLPETAQVRIEAGARVILFTVDSARVLVDGAEEMLDAPATITGGRTFVPLRFVSETLGARVDWHGETSTITIYTH